jgi:hypothetical protein
MLRLTFGLQVYFFYISINVLLCMIKTTVLLSSSAYLRRPPSLWLFCFIFSSKLIRHLVAAFNSVRSAYPLVSSGGRLLHEPEAVPCCAIVTWAFWRCIYELTRIFRIQIQDKGGSQLEHKDAVPEAPCWRRGACLALPKQNVNLSAVSVQLFICPK